MPRIVGVLSCVGPVRTGYSHGFRYSVAGRPVTVVVRTLIDYAGLGWHYRGLRLLVEALGDSIDEVVPAIESAADTALGMLSGAAAAETGALRMHLLYEDVEPGESGEMVAYSVRRHSDLKLHKAMWSHLQPLYLGMASADASTRGRVDRALRWYRTGVTEGDPVDRFAAFWIGLESLNVLLERKWGLVRQERHCPKCGQALGKELGLLGLERLLRDMPECGPDKERRIRKLRNKLLHATDDLRTNAADAAELAEIIAVAVTRGVAEVFGWTPERAKSLARAPLPAPPVFGAQAMFRFVRPGPEPLGVPGFHPRVELETTEHVTHEADGEPNRVEYSATVHIVASPGLVVQEDSLRVFITKRTGPPLLAAAVRLLRNHEQPSLPAQRGKGVSLWELGDNDIWYPDPKAAV